MKVMWPLFWCLKPEAQALLMQYQAEHHEDKPALDIASQKAPWQLPSPKPEIPLMTEEELEEVDRLMRQPPSRSRGKDG